ncbi:50S ribosomal protein L18 [Mycoplasmatota bacterium]|nr:50S ribosomal protein L18 [Mycoplasmatota bacterium]
MINKPSRNETRKKRHLRIRQKISGTPNMPRLNVFRSARHIEAQLIDDTKQVTLVSASTKEKELNVKNGGNIEAAKLIGKLIAERAQEKDVKKIIFDRAGYLYHGRVKAMAEAAREAGLEF